MRVLVTGGNGFLGSHVIETLQQRGHEVRLLLRTTSRRDNLAGMTFEVSLGDFRDEASLRRAVEGVDVVIHAAGSTAELDEAGFMAINAGGTAAIARVAAEAGVRRFVQVSSLAAQGPSPDGRIDPDAAARPVSAYGRSKLAGEAAALHHADTMSVAVMRPSAIYGPRDRGFLVLFRAMRLGLMPLYGDGLNQVSWIHALDAATAIVAAAEADGPAGSIYTLSDGTPHTWRQLAELLAQQLGRRVWMLNVPPALYLLAGHAAGVGAKLARRPLLLSPDKVRDMSQRYQICGNDRITAELGWRPAIDAEQGIAITLRWYREQGWL